MATRLIRKQTGLTYEPIPGLLVEYTIYPGSDGKIAARRENCEPPEEDEIVIEIVTFHGHELPSWLTVDEDKLREAILR